MGTLHEAQETIFIISCSRLLKKRNVSDKTYGSCTLHFGLNYELIYQLNAIISYKKEKQSHYRPGVAQRVPGS